MLFVRVSHSSCEAGYDTGALAGAEIGFDKAAQLGVRCQEMNMDLVGTESRTAPANFCKVQGRGRVADTSNGQHQTATFRVTMDEDVVAGRNRRAFEQAVDGVNITPARRTAPELKAIREARRTRLDNCRMDNCRSGKAIDSIPARSVVCERDDLCCHAALPISKPAADRPVMRFKSDALHHSRKVWMKCGSTIEILWHGLRRVSGCSVCRIRRQMVV